jgi:3-methyladenine DNA glycosylase AlkD
VKSCYYWLIPFPSQLQLANVTRTRPSPSRGSLAVEREFHALANPERAAQALRFFKTGPGQYGEGDRFLGLTVPQIRGALRTHTNLSLSDMETLLESPWHEVRLFAVLALAHAMARRSGEDQRTIYEVYLRRTDRINNWDLVDSSAPQIVGGYLDERSRAPLYKLARSRDLWERRIAIIATLHFIRQGDVAETMLISEILLGDTHDLIHKAVGWMLREAGKKDQRALQRFLDQHAAHMPRTMLRYALERLPAATRKRYMTAKQRHPL